MKIVVHEDFCWVVFVTREICEDSWEGEIGDGCMFCLIFMALAMGDGARFYYILYSGIDFWVLE